MVNNDVGNGTCLTCSCQSIYITNLITECEWLKYYKKIYWYTTPDIFIHKLT